MTGSPLGLKREVIKGLAGAGVLVFICALAALPASSAPKGSKAKTEPLDIYFGATVPGADYSGPRNQASCAKARGALKTWYDRLLEDRARLLEQRVNFRKKLQAFNAVYQANRPSGEAAFFSGKLGNAEFKKQLEAMLDQAGLAGETPRCKAGYEVRGGSVGDFGRACSAGNSWMPPDGGRDRAVFLHDSKNTLGLDRRAIELTICEYGGSTGSATFCTRLFSAHYLTGNKDGGVQDESSAHWDREIDRALKANAQTQVRYFDQLGQKLELKNFLEGKTSPLVRACPTDQLPAGSPSAASGRELDRQQVSRGDKNLPAENNASDSAPSSGQDAAAGGAFGR